MARIVAPEPKAQSVKILKWPKMSARYGGIMRPGTDVALMLVSISVEIAKMWPEVYLLDH